MASSTYAQVIDLIDQLSTEEVDLLFKHLEERIKRRGLSHEEFRAHLASQMKEVPWFKQLPPEERE